MNDVLSYIASVVRVRDVAEKGTGFVWEKNDWVQTNFQAQPYVLNNLEPDNKICTLFGEWGRPIFLSQSRLMVRRGVFERLLRTEGGGQEE
jgi:hypothetical protein